MTMHSELAIETKFKRRKPCDSTKKLRIQTTACRNSKSPGKVQNLNGIQESQMQKNPTRFKWQETQVLTFSSIDRLLIRRKGQVFTYIKKNEQNGFSGGDFKQREEKKREKVGMGYKHKALVQYLVKEIRVFVSFCLGIVWNSDA